MKSSTRLVMGILFILGIMILLIMSLEWTSGETINVSQDGSRDAFTLQDGAKFTGCKRGYEIV